MVLSEWVKPQHSTATDIKPRRELFPHIRSRDVAQGGGAEVYRREPRLTEPLARELVLFGRGSAPTFSATGSHFLPLDPLEVFDSN